MVGSLAGPVDVFVRSPCAGILSCPVCHQPLADEGASLRCPAGHAFDRAREGYVHLLPAGHGLSGIEGDPGDMVGARRRFLERGHYGAVSRAVELRALRHLSHSDGRLAVVDAGCGEGYWLRRVARAARESLDARDACFLGVDVSKAAIRSAARLVDGVEFVVGDVKHRLPVRDRAVTVLLDIFAPRNPDDFARVLRPGGLALVVIPEEDHLHELRAKLPLLGMEEDKRDRTVERFRDRFRLAAEERVAYPAELDRDDVIDLLRMTPSRWHLDEADIERAGGLGPTALTVAVRVLAFEPRAF